MVTHGSEPYYECSSRGDKRFSAFFARIRGRDNKTIEELYQASKVFKGGITGLSWRDAKGKKPINVDACRAFYAQLWDEYIEEHPELVYVLLCQPGLSDIYGKEGNACQATELWRIRERIQKERAENK